MHDAAEERIGTSRSRVRTGTACCKASLVTVPYVRVSGVNSQHMCTDRVARCQITDARINTTRRQSSSVVVCSVFAGCFWASLWHEHLLTGFPGFYWIDIPQKYSYGMDHVIIALL
eukprot:scaffold16774_cov40-Prasinocladus_malaysianus.AAC.1